MNACHAVFDIKWTDGMNMVMVYHHGTTVQQVSLCVWAQRLRDDGTMKRRVSLAGRIPKKAADCIHSIVFWGAFPHNFILPYLHFLWPQDKAVNISKAQRILKYANLTA